MTILRKSHSKSIRKDGQQKAVTKKRTKWDLKQERKADFNNLKTRTYHATVFSTLQRRQRKYRHNRRLHHGSQDGIVIKYLCYHCKRIRATAKQTPFSPLTPF